jgi:alanyl-tRNA synthetase
MTFSMDKALDLQFFHEQGFSRKTCTACKSWFWTLDAARSTCGDAPCVEYTFIEEPLTTKPFKLDEMRETYLRFFEAREHTRLKRYPVVARWREDIYLTIASIADFQPFVTSGEVPPPANPLTISQPCIRLNDLANVGKSGRHMTLFEMMAHHAFNTPKQPVYWANETVAYGDEFLHKTLGIARDAITYKENPWAGGGNAGPAVEVLAGGLEVATLVFMNLAKDAQGTIDVKGDKYREMDLKIVDTGWGLERLTWASQGTPTAYDAVYPELIEYVRSQSDIDLDLEDPDVAAVVGEHARLAGVMNLDAGSNLHELRAGVAKRLAAKGHKLDADALEKMMEPIEDMYALGDHARCLSFMLGDGIVPSNAKAGYLCRLMVRRSLRLMESLNFKPKLRELVATELEFLSETFPELRREKDTIEEILDLESDRYAETISKGRRLVEGRLKRGEKLGTKELIELYDSQGLPPQVVQQVAESMGTKVEIPDAFDAMVAERHSQEEDAKATGTAMPDVELPETKMGYYEDPLERQFDASVLWTDGKRVVLDRTLFFPEGGGQPHDTGTLKAGDSVVKVTYVEKRKGIIFHHVDGKVKAGEVIHGRVDWDRRVGHMRHHTATHIVNGATRAVLGAHAWQTGVQKAVDHARIDITHFQRISDEEIAKIEALSNEVVMRNIPLDRNWMERDEAEKRYGMLLYQGGVVPGRKIRVIRIGDHDVEACGGTHCASTSEVGPIKILRTERIQDGVERIVYAAGPSALAEIRRREALLNQSAQTLSVPSEKLPETVDRFFKEWKGQRKEIEDLRAQLADLRRKDLVANAEVVAGVRLIVDEVDPADLETIANAIVGEGKAVAVLGGSRDGRVRLLVARSPDVPKVNAGAIIKEAAPVVGGSGGGRPEAAQGGGTEPANLAKALETAASLVKKQLGAN